jgi:tetratricopeptide (TPR) repeat protein
MGVRELKDEAVALYARRKYTQSARTYGKLLELEPGDPHLHIRHAEAWRRAGDIPRAVSAYRRAAELLLSLGCEARARAAMKVALELDPRDTDLAHALHRLTAASGARREDFLGSGLLSPLSRRELLDLHVQPAVVPGRLALPQAPASLPPAAPSRPEVKRLSPQTLAVRAAPGTRWLVVSSRSPLTAYEVEDLSRVVSREFTLEPTVEAPDPKP